MIYTAFNVKNYRSLLVLSDNEGNTLEQLDILCFVGYHLKGKNVLVEMTFCHVSFKKNICVGKIFLMVVAFLKLKWKNIL